MLYFPVKKNISEKFGIPNFSELVRPGAFLNETYQGPNIFGITL
jgi:hypothetical protein